MAGRPLAPNPAGAHFLRDRELIAQLVRAAGAGEGRLVLDLGAGGGAITARLDGRRRLLVRAAIDPAAPAAELTAEQWHRLAVLLASQ